MIAELLEDNRVFKEQLHGKRLRLDDEQLRPRAATGRCLAGSCSTGSQRSSRSTRSSDGTAGWSRWS